MTLVVVEKPAFLWRTDYSTGFPWGWRNTQALPGRITIVDDPVKGKVMQAVLLPGDHITEGHRSETQGRVPTYWSTGWRGWPDPAFTERWMRYDILVDAGFVPSSAWAVITQIKGYHGGSPPVSVALHGSKLRIEGNSTFDLGDINPGAWTRLVIGRYNSPVPGEGWLNVFRDGVEKVPRTPVRTMDYYGADPDPTYLKQGVYASSSFPTPITVRFGNTFVGVSRASL